MSYTALKKISKAGRITYVEEFQNAHGFQPFVWGAIGKKYFGNDMAIWTNKRPAKDPASFWRIIDDGRLSTTDRLVLAASYDFAIIEGDRLKDISTAFREFSKEHHVDGYVDHLPAIADAIDKLPGKKLFGVCFYGTSVGEDVWSEWDERRDRSKPYNIKTGKKHWMVFENYETNEEPKPHPLVDAHMKQRDCDHKFIGSNHCLKCGWSPR